MESKFEVPVPVQEKVGRWVTWGVIAAAVVAAGNLLLPYVNSFLDLVRMILANGFYIGLSIVGLTVLSYMVVTFAPLVKQSIDLLAQRATWALVNADPVGHLRIWLDEVRSDKREFGTQLEAIGQAKGTVESSRDDAIEAAKKAQQMYNASMRQGNGGNSQASVAAGKYTESARRYEKMLIPLTTLELELTKLYAVYEREEFNLKTDIDIQSKEWEVAQHAGRALDSAFRFLTKKSKKQAFAEQASKVISDRYAGNFGRLRTLKNLSKDLISSFDLETGMYDTEAYERWQRESALVIDNRSAQPVLESPAIAVAQARPLF